MGRFKDCSALADVGARCHSKTTHHRGGGIGDVITVEIQRGQDRILLRSGLNLLKDAVGNAIVHHHHLFPLAAAVAGADAVDHSLNFSINGLFLFRSERVVARLNHAGVGLHA